jgi:aspartyl-tRNA(Asn)/glutamyl-tRNA(Gln) amidotransferase subunit A
MAAEMDLLEAAEALQAGRTTSRALVEECLDRASNPAGQGACTFVRIYDREARASADAMDRLRQANRAPSVFAGVPITIKDLFDVAGETTQAGSRALAQAAPAQRTAPAIERLLAAGLVLIGRTNMTEFAFSGVGINPHFGTPLCPWDRASRRIPGGSSSGAAVSVTDGFAYGAIGTDTGGSCRIPAALCGIVGFKPTARRVPLQGAVPLSPTLDSVGPLARSVGCCAVLDSIMSGQAASPIDVRPVAGLRLVLPTNQAFDHLDAATEASLDGAIALLDAAGVVIDRRPLAAIDRMNEAQAQGGFAAAEAFAWHEKLLATASDAYDPRVSHRIKTGENMTAAQYIKLVQARRAIIELFEAETAPYDAVIMPTVPITAPKIADFDNDDDYRRLNFLLLRNPATINFMNGCAISVPCHKPGAPPAGLMIAAPQMQDQALLHIAQSLELVLAKRR